MRREGTPWPSSQATRTPRICRKRVEGVLQKAAEYPEISIVGTFYHIETPQDAAAEVVAVQQRLPGYRGVGHGRRRWALFTQSLLTDLDPDRMKIISVDALPPQLTYIEQGIVPVLWGTAHLPVGIRIRPPDRREDPP